VLSKCTDFMHYLHVVGRRHKKMFVLNFENEKNFISPKIMSEICRYTHTQNNSVHVS